MPKKVDCATIEVVSDSLIRTSYSDNCLINAHHLEKIRGAYTDLNGDEDLSNLRLLVVFEGELEISRDIGERYINGRVRQKTGEALVSANLKTREYLKAASAVMQSSHPVMVFETETSALEWLNEL